MGAQRKASAPRRDTAVGYLRRSTDRQEQSIPDQKRAIERYAAENGLRLLRFYTDDAISGTSALRRPAFQQMVGDAQGASCPFGTIVVYDVKRFGRLGNDEAGYYRHVLHTHGVEVLYATEGFHGDGTDDLLRPVKQWQAREESKDLSKVTIRGQEELEKTIARLLDNITAENREFVNGRLGELGAKKRAISQRIEDAGADRAAGKGAGINGFRSLDLHREARMDPSVRPTGGETPGGLQVRSPREPRSGEEKLHAPVPHRPFLRESYRREHEQPAGAGLTFTSSSSTRS